jgi:hypothetical protein
MMVGRSIKNLLSKKCFACFCAFRRLLKEESSSSKMWQIYQFLERRNKRRKAKVEGTCETPAIAEAAVKCEAGVTEKRKISQGVKKYNQKKEEKNIYKNKLRMN